MEEIDRLAKNRSKFVLEGVRRELLRRRREALRQSLLHPHPQSAEIAEEGLGAWSDGLPEQGGAELVEPSAGAPVRWVQGRGWVDGQE